MTLRKAFHNNKSNITGHICTDNYRLVPFVWEDAASARRFSMFWRFRAKHMVSKIVEGAKMSVVPGLLGCMPTRFLTLMRCFNICQLSLRRFLGSAPLWWSIVRPDSSAMNDFTFPLDNIFFNLVRPAAGFKFVRTEATSASLSVICALWTPFMSIMTCYSVVTVDFVLTYREFLSVNIHHGIFCLTTKHFPGRMR